MLKKLLSIFVIILALAFALSPMSAEADFGDFSGDDDYGYDYDDYDYDYDYDDDDDYYYGGSYSGGSGGNVDEVASLVLAIFVVIIMFLYVHNKNRKSNGKSRGSAPLPPGATPTGGLWPMDTILKWDPNFSADEMKERLSNLYVQMQNCWTAKDITPLRGDFTDVQFAQYDMQLDRYRNEGITNVIERIAVLDVTLMGVKQDESHDILIANISTRITTYSVKDETGEIVRGDKNKEKFMRYEWTLIRPKGARTQAAEDATVTVNCPNCGAALNINRTAKCPYCDSIVSKPNYNWVIAGIKGLSQRTS